MCGAGDMPLAFTQDDFLVQNCCRSLTVLLLTSLYFLIRRKLPYVTRTSIKWVLLSTALIFTHNVIFYSHYVKFVPLGAIGSIANGCDMILTTFFIFGSLNGTARSFRLVSSVLIILGFGLIVYSVINPVLQTLSDLELCSQRITKNCLDNFQGFTINGSDSVQELKTNPSSSLMNVQKHAIGHRNCSSYEDKATSGNSTFWQEIKSSHTMIGVLAILLSALPRIGIALTFSGPLKNENIFAVVFWFGFITTASSFTLSWTVEHPEIPNSKTDILLIFIHALTVTMLSFAKTTAMKYVSPITYDVIVSFSVPLMLIFEYYILVFCFEGKQFEIIQVPAYPVIFLVSFDWVFPFWRTAVKFRKTKFDMNKHLLCHL